LPALVLGLTVAIISLLFLCFIVPVFTLKVERVIYSNLAQLISNEVVNWTFTDRERRLELKVGVAYGNDPAKVIEILQDTLAAHEKVRSQPSPIITFDGFGESTLNFTMRYWGQLDDMLRISSDVAIAVYRSLTNAGIEIPVPQRDLRLRDVQGPLKLASPDAAGTDDTTPDPPRTERGAD